MGGKKDTGVCPDQVRKREKGARNRHAEAEKKKKKKHDALLYLRGEGRAVMKEGEIEETRSPASPTPESISKGVGSKAHVEAAKKARKKKKKKKKNCSVECNILLIEGGDAQGSYYLN